METNPENFILPPKISDKKTLVLDLDETLVHSQFLPFSFPSDVVLNINIENESHDINVLIRPGAKEFIRKMQKFFEVIMFTASVQKYASPIMDIIDDKKYCQNRLFREHCTFMNNAYVKDLKKLGRELKDIVIVDNSPLSYSLNPENGIPVVTWIEDKRDRELYNLIPILEFLSGVNDVREFIPKIVFNNEISYYASRDIIKKYNDKNKKNQNKIEVKNNNLTETSTKVENIENKNETVNNVNNLDENKVNNIINEDKKLAENKQENEKQNKDNKTENNCNIEKKDKNDKNVNYIHIDGISDSLKKNKMKKKINKSVKNLKKVVKKDSKKLETNSNINNSKPQNTKIKSSKPSTSIESKLKTMQNKDHTQTSRNQKNTYNINKINSKTKTEPYLTINNKLIDNKSDININQKINSIPKTMTNFNYKHKKHKSVTAQGILSTYQDNQKKDLMTINIGDSKFTPKSNKKVLYLKTTTKSKLNNLNENLNRTVAVKDNKKILNLKGSQNNEIVGDDLSSINNKSKELLIGKKFHKNITVNNTHLTTLYNESKSKSLKKTLYDSTISSENKIKKRKNTEGKIVKKHNKVLRLVKRGVSSKENLKKDENKKDNKIENKNENNKQNDNTGNKEIKVK